MLIELLLFALTSVLSLPHDSLNHAHPWIIAPQPELTLANEAQVRGYIRTNSTPTQPVLLRDIKEALPPNGISIIEDLERRGEVLIMRSLTGQFKDVPLPRLGKANRLGLKINDNVGGAGQRFKSIWWDDLRERDRAGKRVDDGTSSDRRGLSLLRRTDFIFAWDEVPIKDTDDIVKLLEKGK